MVQSLVWVWHDQWESLVPKLEHQVEGTNEIVISFPHAGDVEYLDFLSQQLTSLISTSTTISEKPSRKD